LATDDALAADVVLHFLRSVPFVYESDPIILYLQPTSPLRTAAHIDKALADMMRGNAPGVVSVVELMRSPFKSFRIDAKGYLQALFSEAETNLNRQALPRTFAANGAIYAFRASKFLEKRGFPSNGSLPLVMSEEESIDIDSQDDLLEAEQIIRNRYGA
jgi:CMP-N-acetylneuraminic acid synthetase